AVFRRLLTTPGPRALRRRRGGPLGDDDDDRGRLLTVRPAGDRLPRCPLAPDQGRDQRAACRGGGQRQTDHVLPGSSRPPPGANGRRLCGPRLGGDRRLHRRAGILVGWYGHWIGATRTYRR